MTALWGYDDTLKHHVFEKKTAMQPGKRMHKPLETKTD
jgi:hypothetical protein